MYNSLKHFCSSFSNDSFSLFFNHKNIIDCTARIESEYSIEYGMEYGINDMGWGYARAPSTYSTSTQHRRLYPTEHSRGRVPRFDCGRADTEFDVEFDAGIFSLRPSVDTISTLTRYHTATLLLIVRNVRHESSLTEGQYIPNTLDSCIELEVRI